MKSIFELFIKQKIEFKFVLFSIGQILTYLKSLVNLILDIYIRFYNALDSEV